MKYSVANCLKAVDRLKSTEAHAAHTALQLQTLKEKREEFHASARTLHVRVVRQLRDLARQAPSAERAAQFEALIPFVGEKVDAMHATIDAELDSVRERLGDHEFDVDAILALHIDSVQAIQKRVEALA